MKAYNVKLVKLIIAGFELEAGFADGDICTISKSTAAFTSKVGSDGEVTRSATNDDRAIVKVFLMQTSRGNDILTALYNRDVAAPNGAGVGAFRLADLNGNTVNSAPHIWINKLPEQAFGREAGVREWECEVDKLSAIVGGNPDVP